MITLDTALTAAVYLLACLILFALGKLAYKVFQKNINVKDELTEKDNFAFAIAHVGYYVGLILAISSAIIGPSAGLWEDLMNLGIYGVLAIILLNLSIIINNKIVLRKFSVYKEIIHDRNVGTGVIEGANAVGTGLIILGAVSGEGGSVLTAVIFWLVGQVLLMLTAYFYTWVVPFDVHAHIEKDNIAVGLGFAGALVAIANLIRFGLMMDFFSWQDSLYNVGIDVVIGLLLLPIARYITDKILLPGRSLTDELINQEKPNTGAGLIEAFAYIGGSVLITLCL